MTEPDQQSRRATTGSASVPGKRRGLRRIAAGLAVVASAGVIAGELVARYHYQLGDPPLSRNDPEIGYLFQPNQTCRRLHHLIHYNAWSMRSRDFPLRKADPRELRVMVVGDSVINGGVLTDQAEVGTSLLERDLAARLGRPVVVGNVSSGGWGPLNEWPYLRRFGTFDADVLVLVESSHDAFSPFQGDRVAGVDPSFPDRRPCCALWEAVTRYLPRYLPSRYVAPSNEGYQEPVFDEAVLAANLAAVRSMIDLGKARGARVLVALHWTQTELRQAAAQPGFRPRGHVEIAAAAAADGAQVLDLGPAEQAAGPRAYRDDIHVGPVGQRVMEQQLLAALAPADRAPAPPPSP